MLIEHSCQFGHGHSVARRNRKLADERCEGSIEYVSRNLRARDWIGTIANNDLLAQSFASPHAIRHRVSKRVDATSNAL